MMPTQPPVDAIVLAAGPGSRMKSERPKPLHRLCGRPMLRYVLDALAEVDLGRAVVVVGHKGDWVSKALVEDAPPISIEFVEQAVQRGTGDAALVGLVALPSEGVADLDGDDGDVLVLPGDAPLLQAATVRRLLDEHRRSGAAATVLTAHVDDPSGLGRVIRGRTGSVSRIVEHGDASDDERAIREVNTSIYCFRRSLLAPALRRLTPENSQGEYYLTDAVGVLVAAGHPVGAVTVDDSTQIVGVNDRVQLAAAECELRARTNRLLMAAGVTMLDPATTYIDTTVTIGRDVTLFPGTLLSGRTVVGDGCEIGPNTRLVDTTVGSASRVEMSHARHARIGADCAVGPFAALGPGVELPDGTVTGPHLAVELDPGA